MALRIFLFIGILVGLSTIGLCAYHLITKSEYAPALLWFGVYLGTLNIAFCVKELRRGRRPSNPCDGLEVC